MKKWYSASPRLMGPRFMGPRFMAQGLLVSALGLSACVDGGDTIQVLRNQLPQAGCLVPDSATATFMPRGRIESSAAGGYLFTPLIENRAVPNAAADRNVFVDGANVDLKFSDDLFSEAEIKAFNDSGLARFKQSFSGSIPAGGLASFAFEVLPKGLLDEIDNRLADGQSTQVVAQVEVLGTLDGGDIESNLFSYPIQVCKGCLIQNLGSCESIISEEINTGGVCQALQDGILDCCTDAEGGLVCGDQIPAA